ncbi:hypothetical protein LCGC14_1289190 [marine sediment metagenome]|uniref:HlyD family efflux transporter periplasmic adaptor subunit n=2 Tax=root TaxID=1 RepID=A0A831VQU8_9FLAO|nr:HlyD family efflux transporter periplasmic adaptor subunit [Pricia antarctica]
MDFDSNTFLGRPPGWLTRIGITMVAGILLIILLASFIISYSDVLEAEIEIMPINSSVVLKASRSGQISEFFVNPGDSVVSGDIIAKLNTVAHYVDILAIKEAVTKQTLPEELGFGKPISIGFLQEAYSEYIKAFYGIRTIEKFYDDDIKNLLNNKIRDTEDRAFSDVYHKLQTAKINNALITQNHSRMEILYNKGVISKSELEKSQLELNKSLQEINQLSSDYSRDSYTTNEKFEGHLAALEITSMKVLSEISIWEERNFFISPVNGRVFYLDVWSPFQSVEEDEELFGISPNNKSHLMGIIKIPVHNSGKVRIGQKVIIKLHSFPYEEWGTLEGILTEISTTPKSSIEPYYPAYVKIDTSINKLNLALVGPGKRTGYCDIILEEKTLFKKMFVGFRKKM